MKKRMNILRIMYVLVFFVIVTITNPGFSFAEERTTTEIEEFRINIKKHKDDRDKYIQELKVLEKTIARDSMALKELDPADVLNIEIVKLDLHNGELRLNRQTPQKSQEVIKGFLSLCKKAAKYNGSRRGNWFLNTNYILVVNLKNKETLAVPYSLSLAFPFGEQLESQELSEALCAMTIGCKGSLINFDQGKIINETKFSASFFKPGYSLKIIAPVPLSTYGLKMNEEGKIFLTIEERVNGEVTINETIPFHYGQAQIINHEGYGSVIAYIEDQTEKND